MAYLGDPTNIEIIVDTININDGTDVGLSLYDAVRGMLIQPDGTKVHMYSATEASGPADSGDFSSGNYDK
jgi:hypothetical protein